jgi:hypothetical protein
MRLMPVDGPDGDDDFLEIDPEEIEAWWDIGIDDIDEILRLREKYTPEEYLAEFVDGEPDNY